jgi:hypothetical protein
MFLHLFVTYKIYLYLFIRSSRASEVAQVLECLPSKYEALNSNSSTEKKQKEVADKDLKVAIITMLNICIIHFIR